MADLSPQERLQPALLDRLTDNDPEQKIESRDRRVISVQRLRECIRRDLSWLLNTGRLDSLVDLSDYPEVAQSVLNYGIPDPSGMSVARANAESLASLVREAIVRYEPRVLRRTLKVHVDADRDQMNHNALRFRIECDMWAQPMPQSLFLHTAIDLDTGEVDVREGGR